MGDRLLNWNDQKPTSGFEGKMGKAFLPGTRLVSFFFLDINIKRKL